MKKRFFLLLTALSIAGMLTTTHAAEPGAKTKKSDKKAKAGKNKTGPLHHVVAFKFKPSATADQIKGVEEAFAALKGKIPGIVSLKWGTNISPEKHDKGFTHGFVLTFNTDKDRDDYLVHPAHQEFGKLVGPILDDVFVIDFLAKP